MQQFPNDSRITFALIISVPIFVDSDPHKNLRTCFVASVFPEPDSPPIIIDCDVLETRKFLSTLFAVETVRQKTYNVQRNKKQITRYTTYQGQIYEEAADPTKHSGTFSLIQRSAHQFFY